MPLYSDRIVQDQEAKFKREDRRKSYPPYNRESRPHKSEVRRNVANKNRDRSSARVTKPMKRSANTGPQSIFKRAVTSAADANSLRRDMSRYIENDTGMTKTESLPKYFQHDARAPISVKSPVRAKKVRGRGGDSSTASSITGISSNLESRITNLQGVDSNVWAHDKFGSRSTGKNGQGGPKKSNASRWSHDRFDGDYDSADNDQDLRKNLRRLRMDE
ncbi:hypothetical protein SARC_03501 [Sphaeroforma arctica JP610]|uniref:Uncharacterized protein n=1 Tax=Sphaeroforma arctica JP610 TaxID=667725 RepID=A0A0L0G5H0_9EUKA|nr:hypothetical protein SARC_03501 [Sphaeroforma arctica JP610]KNC84275.1 hypothetical protein SARC_03501 [Sphaeroforma arctica JP610]|eukprot:XP_014158177.1 hypothetical protein SARC_03501 [Sphaeroforma arctica JP610]